MIALLVATSVTAQANEEEVPEKPQRTCRLIFPDNPGAHKEVYLFNGKGSIKVSLTGMNLSRRIDLPHGPISLSLSKEPVQSSDELPAESPTIQIREESSSVYLLLTRDPANEELPIALEAIEAGDEELKAGQTIWINYTEHTIRYKFGDHELRIPPMDQVVSPAPLQSNGYYKADFSYQIGEDDSYLPIMKKSWWFDADSKNIGFIVNSGARLPKIFMIRDH